jgi:hypothetical protein
MLTDLLSYYRSGGPIMHFILAVGVIGLAIFLERFYTIVIRSKINGRAFIERVMLANVATLLGLLGTIFGLREAFSSVTLAAAAERSAALAAGIAIALNATGFGLLVAVPLSVAHAYLVSQAETIIEQVDEFSVRLINALIDRPDVRLGHR